MSRNSNVQQWRPSFAPGDESKFANLKSWNKIPTVTYLSTPGAAYYQLTPKDLPRPAPYAEAVTLTIELLGLKSEQAEVGDPVKHKLMALRYTSNKGVTGVFGLRGGQDGSPFLRGRVLFFSFLYNPDPGTEGVAVHRTVALGLKPKRRGDDAPWGDFGFLREIDTFGNGFPEVTNTDEDFQVFSSPAAFPDPESPDGPYLFKDRILSAGSVTALA